MSDYEIGAMVARDHFKRGQCYAPDPDDDAEFTKGYVETMNALYRSQPR